MSNRMQRNFKLTALAAALLSVYGPALAEDGARTSVVLDPNSVSIGIGNWSGGDAAVRTSALPFRSSWTNTTIRESPI